MTTAVGLGGGGTMFCPQVSPWQVDAQHPETFFVSCDQGGLYQSVDGGETWTLLDGRIAHGWNDFSVAFDPSTDGHLAAWHPAHGMQLSSDRGQTWPTQLMLPSSATGDPVFATAAAFSPTSGQYLLVGTKSDSTFAIQRIDLTVSSPSWSTPSGIPLNTQVVSIAFASAFATSCFVATIDGVYWSQDTGATFTALPGIAAGTTINDLAVASDSTGVSLYSSLQVVAGGYGTVWSLNITASGSADPAWTNISGTLPTTSVTDSSGNTQWSEYGFVSAASGDRSTLYVGVFNPVVTSGGPNYAVYKGNVSGSSVAWSGVYDGYVEDGQVNVEAGWVEPPPPAGRDWGFGGAPTGFIVDPKSSQKALYTNMAAVQITTDGGTSWSELYTSQAATASASAPALWQTTGLDVTTTWHYDIQWASPEVHLMSCTDIGLLRSEDGETWSLACFSDVPTTAGGTPGATWGNCYELAFWTGTETVFAAVSNQHDIPHSTQLNQMPGDGAVLRSDDHGKTWKTVAGATSNNWGQSFNPPGGLPDLPTGPVVSLLWNAGVLYASVWMQGVFWSADEGMTWYQLGTFSASKPNCHRIRFDADGNLLCATAGQGGALWRLSAGDLAPAGAAAVAAPWTSLTSNLPSSIAGLLSIMDYMTDPNDVNTIFLCSETSGPGSVGGLFLLVDGTWQVDPGDSTNYNLLGESALVATNFPFWVDAFSVALIAERLYVTTLQNGVYSTDYPTSFSGWWPNWWEYKATPFMGAQRIDTPNQDSQLFIGTFGASTWPVERQCMFVTDHSTISRQEAPGVVSSVAYLILDGFSGPEVGITSPATLPPVTITIGGIAAPQVTASFSNLQYEDSDLDVPQRLTLECDLDFIGTASFPASATAAPVSAMLTWENGPFACSAQVALVYPASPYILDGPISYLSQGLRVFRVLANSTKFGVTLPAAATPLDAQQYLISLLTDLNSGATNFDALPTDAQGASDLQILPQENGENVYNFAVAQVNYPGGAPLDVRVFFRLFRWGAAAVSYDPNGAYRSSATGTPPEPAIPLLGVEAAGAGFEVVTIPCFATSRVTPSQSMTMQTDPLNDYPFAATDTVHYYGCVLDFNAPSAQPLPTESALTSVNLNGPWPAGTTLSSVQDYILGRHQCLIAEVHALVGDADTLTTGDTPSSSDCMSQRNLFILGSDNPGGVDSHTVSHPFFIQALRTGKESREPAARPDELMLWWGNMPLAAQATLYTPEIDVDDILQITARRAGPQRLTRVDAHTLRCDVDGLTYVPLPPLHRNAAALLTIELPDTVRYGESYEMHVRQLGGAERALLGGFQVTTQVRRPEVLRPDEENTLAVMRYIQQQLAPADPRRMVLTRYVDQIARKIAGLGGQPNRIPPSPYGAPTHGTRGCLT